MYTSSFLSSPLSEEHWDLSSLTSLIFTLCACGRLTLFRSDFLNRHVPLVCPSLLQYLHVTLKLCFVECHVYNFYVHHSCYLICFIQGLCLPRFISLSICWLILLMYIDWSNYSHWLIYRFLCQLSSLWILVSNSKRDLMFLLIVVNVSHNSGSLFISTKWGCQW